MKKSKLTFADGFFPEDYIKAKNQGKVQMAFDWDKAATIIKEHLLQHPDLKAEAGLQEDWNYTGGIIFEDGKSTNDDYTYLSSNWAIPTLILSWDNQEQLEIDCSIENSKSRFDAISKWDDESLIILGINL